MIDSFPAPDASEDVVFFSPSIARDDQPDVLSDCFVRSVAEDALAAGFQDIMTPSRVLLTIASSEDAMIDGKMELRHRKVR